MHKENLLPNEQILETFGVSKKILALRTFIGLLIGSIGFVINFFLKNTISDTFDIFSELVTWIVIYTPASFGLYLIIRAIWFYLSYEYVLTTRRIVEVTGVLAKKTTSATLEAITDTIVNQDPIERFLLNTGTILVNTAGSPHAEVVLVGVANPYHFKEKIQDLATKHALKNKSSVKNFSQNGAKHSSWTSKDNSQK